MPWAAGLAKTRAESRTVWTSGLANRWTSGLADWRTNGLAAWRTSGLADWRTSGLADWRTSGLADWRTNGLAAARIRVTRGYYRVPPRSLFLINCAPPPNQRGVG
jgi:hypothetical protein